MPKLYFVCVTVFLSFGTGWGQRLVDVINQAEKAVLVVRAYSSNGGLKNEGSGFVLSADGIAIVPASLFFEGDSVVVESRGNRRFAVQSVLQYHRQANLALVKLNLGRLRDMAYLIPSKPVFLEGQEVVAFGHPDDIEDGVAFSRVVALGNFVFFKRFGYLDLTVSDKSMGAPVVNSKGEIAGIINPLDDTRQALVLDAQVLTDSNWVSLNLTVSQLRRGSGKRSLLNGELNKGILNLVYNQNEMSARSLSAYIKINNTDDCAYVLRSHARYLYKNTYGSREDLVQVKKLKPQGFLHFYFEGLHCLSEGRKDEALLNFTQSIENKPDFAYALVERGRLLYSVKRNFEAAFADYLSAISNDTTYGEGYYEKARFVLQHFEDKRSAEKDINNAIRLNPDLPGIFVIRGTMRIESQNYLQSITDFDEALKRDRNDMSALFNRGIANYNLGMKDNACKDWQRATDLGHFKAVKYISRYCATGNRKY